MKIPYGNEVYSCDTTPVVARGLLLTDAQLGDALARRLRPILEDHGGQQRLKQLLAGVATTSFEENRVRDILTARRDIEEWRIGEAIAEAHLVDHRQCEFPWPSGRDLRNPNGSPPGADLVGFSRVGGRTQFAFGEVKTSQEERWPPGAMTGRHGLSNQVEDLRDSVEVKDHLVRYLGQRAVSAAWADDFKAAASIYLKDHTDVALHGIMVRDTEPKDLDLKSRCAALAKKRPAATTIELKAIYLPKGAIRQLPGRAAAAVGGAG